MNASPSPLPLLAAPELTDDDLRAALESLDCHELQKIIQAVYATAGGLQ